MKLTLVRHGRPDEDDDTRPHDPPLRADGQAQARAVARLLAGEGVTRVVASPLLRAHQTALPLADALGLPVQTIEGWAEADRHSTRYRSTETLRALGDAQWQRFLADPVRFVGGDPTRFESEVTTALQQVLQDSGARDHVVVFTHGLPINLVLARALGLQGLVHFRCGYGSCSRLMRSDRGRLGVVSVNENGHHAWPETP